MVNILKLSSKELEALVVYREVIERSDRFPKDFWTKEKYQLQSRKVKCSIISQYCLENLAGLKVSDLPKYNLIKIKQLLINGKLSGMVQRVFNHDVLAILKNAYPEEFRTRRLKEWYWSKHGIWDNDDFIIEAVKDMVRKEGIRWIGDIPHFNWKKRLLDNGIYNILHKFNWSIYAMFNFVYPGKFHPADFKYKIKWAASESLENAFYFMHKVFREKGFKQDQIHLLKTVDFRKLGLAGMLASLFDSSTLKAKEYYLFRTISDKDNRNELVNEIKRLHSQKFDREVIRRLDEFAKGKYIYNLHSNPTLYGYIKRHARKNNMTINDFITGYGFVYKSARKDIESINKEEIWNLRKEGLTYVDIARRLGSNPTTISNMCSRYFGGDPLIPRPINDYITVQELMDKYKVDHKTVMKLVSQNSFENHTTIRFRYLKKDEIVPCLKIYCSSSKQHQSMVRRYAVK